jgi:hypothetical protein
LYGWGDGAVGELDINADALKLNSTSDDGAAAAYRMRDGAPKFGREDRFAKRACCDLQILIESFIQRSGTLGLGLKQASLPCRMPTRKLLLAPLCPRIILSLVPVDYTACIGGRYSLCGNWYERERKLLRLVH